MHVNEPARALEKQLALVSDFPAFEIKEKMKKIFRVFKIPV